MGRVSASNCAVELELPLSVHISIATRRAARRTCWQLPEDNSMHMPESRTALL